MTQYVISDTHFDHKSIIKFCNRPFKDVNEMNLAMVHNWNSIVNEEDTVYHLGDVALGDERTFPKRSVKHITDKWIGMLNGKKIFINGNHDPDNFGIPYTRIKYKGIRFMLVHDPNDKRLPGYDGWLIHGHKHNNNIGEYPFINTRKRTINVCVELTGYKPVSLDEIVDWINACNEDFHIVGKSMRA